MPEWRLFNSLVVLRKNAEYLCKIILDRGNANLDLSDGSEYCFEIGC